MEDQTTNTTQKRLRILGDDEIQALYGRPHFTDDERLEYFALVPTEKALLEQLHSIKSRIYFIEEVPDKERSMNLICMILLILLLLPLHAWSKELPLFVIQRNKSKNEVHYHLHVDDTCRIVSTEPVSAFWKLLQESPGKTAPLTGLQRIVYGVVHKHVDDNWVFFHLMPLKERIVKATATYDPATKTCSPIVHAEINKQWAALERIYVHAEEGLLDPELLYIDLIGKSLKPSPQQVTERIHP